MKDPQRKIETIARMLAYKKQLEYRNSHILAEIGALEWALPILESYVMQEKQTLKKQKQEILGQQ